MRFWFVVAACSLGALIAREPVALAEPRSKLWELRTARPREMHREATRLFTEYEMSVVANTFGARTDFDGLLVEMVNKLEAFGVLGSDDWELRLDYATGLHGLERYQESIDILESTLPHVPPNEPRLPGAYFDLAIDYAKTHHRDKEIDAYLHALEHEHDPDVLSNAYSNLSEAYMSMNDLEKAREAVDKSLQLDAHNVLAEWNRAIIVDRQGDDNAGVYFTVVVLSDDPELVYLNSPNVFFEPPYEYDWYRGLAELAKASLEPAETQSHLENARTAFHEFMVHATPSGRFFSRALEHWKSITLTLNAIAASKAKRK